MDQWKCYVPSLLGILARSAIEWCNFGGLLPCVCVQCCGRVVIGMCRQPVSAAVTLMVRLYCPLGMSMRRSKNGLFKCIH